MKFQKRYTNRGRLIMEILISLLVGIIIAKGLAVGHRKANFYYAEKFTVSYGKFIKNISLNSSKIESLIFVEEVEEKEREEMLTALNLYSLTMDSKEYYEEEMEKELSIDVYMFMQIYMSLPMGIRQNYQKFKDMERMDRELREILRIYENKN